MGVEDRYKKRKEEKSSSLYNGVENRYLSKNVETVSKEITNRVNTWLTNNKNYISNAQSRFSGENTSYRTDTSDWLTTVQAQKENFAKEAESIKNVLTAYKDFFGEEYVNSVFEALDGSLKAQDSVIDASNKDREYWSQWQNEEEYNSWYQYRQQIDPILTADDFDEYFSAGEAKAVRENWWSGIENNIAYLRNPENLEVYESAANSANGASWGMTENLILDKIDYKAAKYMTDEEYKVYNYYVGKGDTEKAESFLKSLEDTLTRRQAGELVTDIKGNALKEAFFAVESGLDQFWSGIGSIDNFIMGTEADIPSATQMASSEIRAGIDGIGGVAYDLAQTTANMFPSILAGAVTGGAGGAITLGTSAMGNAYSEMRTLGYDEGQARGYAALVGVSETTLQYALGGIGKLGGKVTGNVLGKVISSIDNAFARTAIELGGNMLSEGLEEAVQEVLDPVFKMLATGEDFEGVDLESVLYSGLLGALSAGLLEGAPTIVGSVKNNSAINAEAKEIYGNGAELVTEALEINPDNAYAQKMQTKLDSGKDLSGGQINRLVKQNESAMYENDITAIQSAVESRLAELGEKGDVKAIATALTKQAQGERLTFTEREIIKSSTYGQRVANELDTENIKSGEYSSSWAERIGTDRINAEEYGRLIQNMEAEDAAVPASNEHKTALDVGYVAETPENTAVMNTDEVKATPVTENEVVPENATEAEISAHTEVSESEESAVTLESASKKYGAQAGAMISTYTEGQDVKQFDAAYQAAYDMGKSGVALSYVMSSEATAYLTESQRELAHAAGADASSIFAKAQDAKNKAAVNGKTGRKKGTVKGEGVSIGDLKKSFNDTQNTAYKLLSTYAEATGIDIVLYKSEANADGEFEGAQGKFKWREDTIYIDINAGLTNIKDVNELAKYTMLRTFAHEFDHFIEKWNPIWYNEFRKVVFDTLTERGENVEDLIDKKMSQSEGMTYDEASREVVAEAMTDILPDANFVEELANKHKTIFEKLLEKLKEFVADLKAYFNSLGHNSSREANALKEQVGEGVKYVENIVKLFDKVAVEAVENYQATVAIEEATVSKTEQAPKEVVSKTENTTKKQTTVDKTKTPKTKSIKNTTHTEEVKPNVENADNRETVRQPDTDRQGDTRVLDEVQAEDVQADVPRGDSVGDSVERGQEAGRDGAVADNGTGTRSGSGDGDSQIGDIRRDDELTPEAEKLHEEVTEQIAQQSTELPKGRNFVIGDSLDLPNGEKARYKANIEAIRLVKQLESEGRYATEAEQSILSKYVGWGGLANAFDERKADWSKEFKELKELLTDEEYTSARGSTLNAHFTDISVIKAMYDGLARLGFDGGRMLEPSSGVGNFVGAMPTTMSAKVKSFTMVELDGVTGLIAKYLYPNADVRIQGFEKANIPDNYMDVAISNVPFGNYPITDKAYPKKVTSAIHNYFFAKSLDKVRPGGIVMFITSSYTMNAKESAVRRYIMQRADLLGAIRLPDSAFKGNAGTEVVTDILVLKKRAANTAYAGEDFLEAPWVYPVKGNYNGAYINSYFENHPEMVLGTASMEGGMYRGNNLTYKALEGRGSLADQIREAFSHIEGKMDYPATLSREKTNFAVERASKNTKKDGYVAKNGKIYQNKNGELVEKTVTPKEAERIAGMLEIRDAARELMTYQQQGLRESEIKKARTKLNKLYDAYVKKNGYLNSPSNKSAFNGDPDRYSLFALENYNPETKKATKADIFTKNTIAPNRTVTSAKDVAEGLIVSVNQTGGVDTALIARLTGKTEADVTRELIDSRKAFKNRHGELEAAEVYLSGNVRAKLRDAEALVPMDSDYKNNVEALKAVIPADVGYQDIFVNAGTPWIPNSVYSDFAAYMLGGRNTEWRQDVDVTRNRETGNFTVELKSRYLKTNAANTQKWGTSRRTFLDLFDAMLNSKSVVVKDKLDDGSFVVNKDATAAANEKIENIQKEFQEWLWQDENRRTELATLYNETFNSVVTPKYNGDNLTVNGANANKPLRPHQRDAVQRVISSGGNTLLAHKVGAGKTYEMAAAAMKLKELGLVKKPMFAVPKSLVAQWGNEFMDFFPTAKLLVAEASDFTAANRKVFMNRIANGEYDAVILSYEQFEKLPMSDDFTRQLYQEQIDSIVAAIEEAKADKGDKALSVKDLEKKRKSLQAKIDKLTDKAKDEDNIDFEGLGVDSLFVDEAHNFKNLFYTTSMTNVSGLGNKDGSKRAFDLYTKVRYLQQLNGGKGIVFATATPVMNSMSEMYIMQKYLQPDLLNQLGLSTFDAWAKQFGEVVNGVEIKPSGQGYRVKQSFSRFKNMSELQLLFRNFADVLTDIPGLKIPKMKGGKVNVVVCEPGQFQQDYMKELEARADNIKNVDPSEDNMLKITSDGRKISYTQRMIDPSLPYEEGCKIFRCADNVIKAYNDSKAIKGTQLIFCDMATPKGKSNNNTTETEELETDMESAKLYDDIKARLRQGGIPAKEIAFIHEADTDAKKKKLFADVNDGKVRVLIGSTGKMGVGMNAQKRVVAIHHLDAPWRPGDVEQRNGRAYRQGNINEEVECFTYVTEGSFDARLWDILERKQNFINQVMNGESVGRETEDTGEVTLSAAEVKALASGSPLIMEQVQLDTDIKKLESLYRAHISAVRSAKERLARDGGEIAILEKQIAAGKADIAARVDTYSDDKFSITVGNKKYTDKKEAGVALMAEATAKATFDGYTTIGRFAGFELRVIKTSEGIKGLLVGKQGYPFKTYSGNTTFMISQLVGVVESIDEKIKLWQHNLTEVQKDIREQEKLINEPFAKQAELDQKRARYNEVMEILNPKEEQSLDGVAEDTVQEQSRAYLGEKDTEGNTLTKEQAEYFKDSKARDSKGNLLVLYHGTANAGFTVFEPSKGKLGGNWFTTSKRDADSYAGNYKGKLFDPAETDDIHTSRGGNFTLNAEMRFDSAEDLEKFKQDNPGAEEYMTDAEIAEQLEKASKIEDWDEYDRLETYQYSADRKRIEKAYDRYEWEHSREATLGELFENPERFSRSDALRAYDAYDSNNAARDEKYTKEDLIEGLKAENDRLLEEDGMSLEDLTFKARIPVGEVGEIVNRANNRTYAVYTNVTKPYEINAYQRTLAGGNLYPSIEAGLSNAEYDGVIVRNARVGAYQEIGDVVIIKESGQVKLTSNKKPTADSDISYQQRTNTLTDREILTLAATTLETMELPEAERDALQIFKNRLSKLEDLQDKRIEEGRLYKEQQFGAKVDRAAADATLNRMRVLDDQIKTAQAEVLSIEDKKVLGDVLKKARRVVEVDQRMRDEEIVKRWRDRTRNSAAIKKYRERIQKDVSELSSWVTKPNNKDIVKHIPDALKNSVIPFLTSIDFTSKQQLKGGEATKADAEFVKRLNGLNAALKRNIDISGMYSGYNDLPPNFMEKLQSFINTVQGIIDKHSGEFVINEMTSEELRELSSVVRVIKAYITQFNKFHANAMYSHVWEAGDNSIEALSAMSSDNGKSGGVSNFVFWQQIRPAFAFERFGKGGEAIYDGLRRGQAQLAFNTQKIVEFTEKAYTDKEVKAWEKEIKTIKLAAGTVKMRVSAMMSFYELSKQPDSMRHMLGEGMRVATYTQDGKKISDNGHTLTEKDIADIINELTPRQKEVADALQKFMAEQGGAWGNYVSVARFGEELFTNERYFPINSDGRHLQSTADENPSAASLYALLNMSFTKSRNELANNRIIIYSIFDVFANHMASMAQYNAMALPVLDAIKWFNYQQKTEDAEGNRYVKDGVREQMDRVYGVPEETRPGSGKQGYAQSFVLNILKAFNGTEAQGIPTDTMGMNALRRNSMAHIAYNFRVVVQQPLAITRAALLVEYRSIIKGMKLKPSAIKQNIEEMRKYSGIAAWKSLGFYDVNISRGLTDTIKHNTDWKQTVGEIGMWGAEQADTLTWAGIWSACKEEVTRKQKLTSRDAGFYEAVTKLFEDVIYKTQVVDSILTKNEFLRSKGLFARAMGSFMSEPTTTASMVVDAVDKYNADLKRGMTRQQAWEKNKNMIGRTMYVYSVSAVILAAVQAVADAFRDDDDYEEFYEKWLEAFGGNLVDELMLINKLPILADFYDLAKELLSIFGVDTYGNPPQSVFMQWYDSLVKGTEIIYDKIAGEDTGYTWYGGIYKLLQAASGMFGLPMATATREVVTAWNNIVGAMAPSLKVKTYDSGEQNEIKYAYQDGYLTFEEAVQELMEQGLVDNEDEAYFTVSGWEAGDGYSRYDKVYDAVRNGGSITEAMNELTSHGYTEKDVISQIKSKVGEWYRGGEVSKEQAVRMLQAYTDMTEEDITSTVNKWSSKVVTGIDYEDIDDEFMAGNITADRATEMYMRYGGMTKEKATEKVTVLEFVKDHPSLDGISYSAVSAYTEYCEPQGIEAEIFYDVWQFSLSATSDVDRKGNIIPGSKKAKVLDYIDTLDLSNKQKDALYYSFGWAKSTISDAPWR